MNDLIEFKNVTLGYGNKIILSNLNFSIKKGDFLGLVGPNGAGKTTVLRSIIGTLKPMSGEIKLHISKSSRTTFGYVPQRDLIDPIMPFTVEDIVMMGRYSQLGIIKFPTSKDYRLLTESLQKVDIENLRYQSFKDLSGGQKQRTLIARALISEPEILVLDEPTSGMDLSSRQSILSLIKKLHIAGYTVILVSHLLSDVANTAMRIAFIEKNFFQVGNVSEILTSENLSAKYGIEVEVIEYKDRKIVITGERNV